MLRLAGAVLVAAGGAWLGFSAAGELRRRERTLRALLGALDWMERELSFRLAPMPELLGGAALRTDGPVSDFFAHCRDGLDGLGEKTLALLWREGLGHLGLDERAAVALEELGDALGRCDGEGQVRAVGRARAELDRALDQAREDRKDIGRMYRVLGVSAGAVLVILLL